MNIISQKKTFTLRVVAATAAQVIALLLMAKCVQAEQIVIPSDEEMLKKGRASVTTAMPSFDAASRTTGQVVPLNLPPESTQLNAQQSPLAKDLANQMFSADLKNAQSTKKGSELIVFVSFSMPPDKLNEYSRQAKEAGAIIVLRGMWENSVTKTQMKAYEVNHAVAQWDINPGVFRKFKVDRVPVIILADSKKAEVVEDGCAVPESYIRVDGAISIRQALLLMRQRGEGNLATDAAKRLAVLEASR